MGEYRVKYQPSPKSWRQAERAEEQRQRDLGRSVISGRVSAQYEGDNYVRGREHDVVSLDSAGRYHLTEVKFRAQADNIDGKDAPETKSGGSRGRAATGRGGRGGIIGAIPLIEQGTRIVNVIRQLTFDLKADSELTLTGKGLPGGSITLEPDEYEIDWVIVNKQGTGFGANVQDTEELQPLIDELTQ